MNHSETITRRVAEIVSQRMADQQAGHGFDHVRRVHRTACDIQKQIGSDLFTIELAALLHDVGDAKFHDGVERSAEFSREILGDLKVDPMTIEHVAHIVDNLSFRKHETAEELSLEGKIVQDADRLDALGAIGIVRTIEYGATVGQPFHIAGNDPSDLSGPKTGAGHFYQKLFRLRDLLHTDPARQIATDREQFMKTFLAQFMSEMAD
ncbi:Metal-dependent phosphohydrolase, HD subdomain protein [Rhodopirellula islandica]|uniref:Metal-dependent phosphohydrolase, HD subdomain protein n=1 Tax=Rhodopirellula islandica TaxID=595434 RepID=A0A0J1BLN0_RHOIS|nr:HD domain-containing protein [Rhodopirellula islandica]KLU07368.1 Metal-dependent phosphohydrolase, HD subdomain protein [Rhodopirellula islandica]